MTREIKFKCFNKIEKKWINNFAIEFNLDRLIIYRVTEEDGYEDITKDCELVEYSGYTRFIFEDVVISLYEGDLIRILEEDKIYEVVFEQGMFCLKGFTNGEGVIPSLEWALEDCDWEYVKNKLEG